MSGFSSHRPPGHVVAAFSGFEADLLRSLASQLVELLHNEQAALVDRDPLEALLDFSGPTSEPEDPVLQRLFPTAYPDDEEAAAEFRRFTEQGLRQGKSSNAALLIDTLEDAGLPPLLTEDGLLVEVELDASQAMAWLRTFTDLRLALAVRLEIEEDDREFWESLPDDDPRSQAHDIYEWVGYLQETLIEAMNS